MTILIKNIDIPLDGSRQKYKNMLNFLGATQQLAAKGYSVLLVDNGEHEQNVHWLQLCHHYDEKQLVHIAHLNIL